VSVVALSGGQEEALVEIARASVALAGARKALLANEYGYRDTASAAEKLARASASIARATTFLEPQREASA
jgi:hypothetical protein